MRLQLQTLFKTTLMLLLLSTAILQAENISAQRELGDKAYTLHEKGKQYFNDKKYNEAIIYFKKSYEAEPSSIASYNIALTYDEKLHDYPNAIKWYTQAFQFGNELAGENLGILYAETLKDYKNAIKWYKKAYKSGNSTGALYLGLLYDETLKEYPKAIKWYTKAYNIGNQDGALNLAILYRKTLKDYPNAIKWYKKGVKDGYAKSINGLAYAYHDQKDYVKATAYILLTINYGYGDIKSTIEYLKNKWEIDDSTILKAYKFQKTIDVPKHYYNKEFEKQLKKDKNK